MSNMKTSAGWKAKSCGTDGTAGWYARINLEEEYREYVSKTPMSKPEREALRRWVREGHSVYESPGSRFLPDSSEPRAFLDVYREDSLLEHAMEGMDPAQRRKYIMEYMGWEEESEEEKAKREARERTPEIVKEHVCKQTRQIFYLWEFLATEGLCQEAREYLEEHMDEPIPFEFDF